MLKVPRIWRSKLLACKIRLKCLRRRFKRRRKFVRVLGRRNIFNRNKFRDWEDRKNKVLWFRRKLWWWLIDSKILSMEFKSKEDNLKLILWIRKKLLRMLQGKLKVWINLSTNKERKLKSWKNWSKNNKCHKKLWISLLSKIRWWLINSWNNKQ